MNAAELTARLHNLIPLTKAMGAYVAELTDDQLLLTAPLTGNQNHAGSAFAGSLYSLAGVAGWAFLHRLVTEHGIDAELMLADGRIRYRRPLRDELAARVVVAGDDQQRFIATLRRGHRARLRLAIDLPSSGTPAAQFEGVYVAARK